MTKANSRIRPAAKFFFEGDKKFFVKGVTYGPFKPDAEGNYVGRPEQAGCRSGADARGRFERCADLSFAAALVP